MLVRMGVLLLLVVLSAANSPAARAQSTVTIETQAPPAGATLPIPVTPLTVDEGDYPIRSLLMNSQGVVALNLLVDPQGRVSYAQTLKSSGDPNLDQGSALLAKDKWLFRPALKDGNPTSGSLKVDVTWRPAFTLADEYKRDIPDLAKLAPGAPVDFKPAVAVTQTVNEGDYPSVSQQRGEQGVVYVKFLVLEDGNVGDTQIEQSSRSTRLDSAASGVVKRLWKYKPATLNGKPVRMWEHLQMSFCIGRCGVDISKTCRMSPTLGDGMVLIAGGTGAGTAINHWIHINAKGAIDSLLVQTDDGWMRASDGVTQALSRAAHYPTADAGKRPDSCWLQDPVNIKGP
jgi:TonB family protein